MRHYFTVAVSALALLAMVVGCGPSKELQLITKMNADERAVLGEWRAVPDKTSPEMAQFAKLFGGSDDQKEDKPELRFMVDKTFGLSVMTSEMTGTWSVKHGSVHLVISAVDGIRPAEVEKAYAALHMSDSSPMPIFAAQSREAMGTFLRHMSLDFGEKYKELTLTTDKKALEASAALPAELALFGLGKSFKKVKDGATGQMLKG